MSVGLHQKCLQQLSEKLAEILPKIKVTHRMFIESWSAAYFGMLDPILPKGEVKKKLEQFVSESPALDFIHEYLSKELSEKQEYDPAEGLLPLTSLPNYTDAKASAERLVQEFESLPWEYSVAVPFKNDFGELFAAHVKNVVLSDSLRLVAPDKPFTEEFPAKSGAEREENSGQIANALTAFLAMVDAEWNPKAIYLQVKVNGFIGHYGTTTPLHEAISTIKAFCGVGIALRLFKVNYNYRWAHQRRMLSGAQCFIHRRVGLKWQKERSHELEAETANVIEDLVLRDVDGTLKTEAKKVEWIKERLETISTIFRHKAKAERILLASQWLFDSYCGKNELLSFVQTTVVLEILLGDKATSDVMGLGELLRNRCAYLIANTQTKRQEILEKFKKIYDVRSQIVRRGKSRLTEDERELFLTFQWMCRRVIQAEVNLLMEDIRLNEKGIH